MGAVRVVYIAEDVSVNSGGVPAVVHQLSERLIQQGASVQVVHSAGDPDELPPGLESFTFPSSGLRAKWSWGSGLRSAVTKLAAPSDHRSPLFHIHGAWSAPQYFAARAAYDANVPFVLSAHGMLSPWLWNEQGLLIRTKKSAYWRLFAYPALSRAKTIHATTPLERDYLARLFPNGRIEVIPNAINVENSQVRTASERSRSILFLGRVEASKGVDILISSFAQARIDIDWSLDIVGPVWSDAYMEHLKSIVAQSGLANRVSFHAPVFGDEKNKLLEQAWVMAVPSHSEAMGLVNLEAAKRYLPTITTFQTGLHDWECGGGVLIEPDIDALARALEKACSWTAEEQYERGALSRRLVEERYSWTVVLPMWMRLYESLLEGR